MKIHLTGIGGVGMAGLAFLLKSRGHEVDGCDLKSTPRTKWLESIGIPVSIGHDPAHVEGKDLVVVTPAVARDNPEYVAAAKTPQPQLAGAERIPHPQLAGAERIPHPQLDDGPQQLGMRFPNRSVVSRGEVLAKLVSDADDSIAVCGSHGKTTTSTFIAKLLIALGENVEWAIGGETGSFPVAGFVAATRTSQPQLRSGTEQLEMRPPGRSVLVVEADESDGTLALYHAKTLVVTNCEYDHPDHFRTKEDYFACYETAKRNAGQVIEGSEEVRVKSEEVFKLHNSSLFTLASSLVPSADPNAMLAVRVALSRGHAPDRIATVLPRVTAELPDRRFQRLSIPFSHSHSSLPLVFTDYGHHPTEIRYSIARARSLLQTSKRPNVQTSKRPNAQTSKPVLRVLFQPHRYSRTAAFLKEFADSLRGADEVVLCPVYSAFEKPVPNGTSADLYAMMRELEVKSRGEGEQRMFKLFLARSCEEAWIHAKRSYKDGDLTLIQGAGDILEKVRRKSEEGRSEVRKIWIGAGTNTVKSDLNLSVEYVKSDSPAGRIGMELLSPSSSLFTLHSSLFPWMAGIPGTLGGWVKMNAGAHGHSIGEVIESVKVDGKWIPAADCGFSYRHSDITGEIQDVRWREVKEKGEGEQWNPSFFLEKRKKFPAHTRGSVFRNPEGDSAGRLLEEAGCKGLRVGGAYVWSEHANVIVAPPGEATASDFLALSQLMRNRVFFRFGIILEPEVCGI